MRENRWKQKIHYKKIYIKKEKKKWYIKKRKKEEKRKGAIRRVLLVYTFTTYHQGPWSIHTICVCSLALLIAWVGLYAIKPLCSRLKASSTYDVGKYTQVCKGDSMFTNNITHVSLHENINLLIHALLVYVLCSSLGIFYIDIPIGLLN
jgi:hypothetical protein